VFYPQDAGIMAVVDGKRAIAGMAAVAMALAVFAKFNCLEA